MTVYVDDARLPYGRKIMCHMIADSTEDLHAMADRIGLARKWIQRPGTPAEHYDVSLGKRRRAVHLGAKEITWRQCAQIIMTRRRLAAQTRYCRS